MLLHAMETKDEHGLLKLLCCWLINDVFTIENVQFHTYKCALMQESGTMVQHLLKVGPNIVR